MAYNRTEKLTLSETDLCQLGILDNYDKLRKELLKSEQRTDCILIQGGAFVIQGKAFLLMGTGGIDFLDSLSQLDGVDGIIGNGNTLFLARDFGHIYSAQTTDELKKCYESESFNAMIKFIESAPVAPLIFLIRSFKSSNEYNLAKKKVDGILFEVANTFSGKPLRFAGSLKSRLRGKFISAARIVHCARRPTIMEKEYLFDSINEVRSTIENFKGHVALVYTLWSQKLCDVIGMANTRNLVASYNPTDPITPHFVKISREFL